MYPCSNQRGSIIPLLMGGISSVLLIASLAISGTYSLRLKNDMQKAADAGALAGAVEASKKNDNSRWLSQAQAAILFSGFRSDVCNNNNGECVTVNFPSQGICDKSNMPNAQQVEAIITKPHNYIFSLLKTTVKACSVASLAGYTTCLLSLEPANTGVNMNGSGTVTVANCGFTIDSTSSRGLYCQGASGAISSMFFNIVGGYSCRASLSPVPATGTPPVADPLRSENPPTFSANCTNSNPTIPNNATLSPGVYCGGITIGNNNTATFNPGQYILLGGGFNVGAGARISGAQVSFYNTCVKAWQNNSPCPSTSLSQTPSGCMTSSNGIGIDCSTPQPFNISGNATVNVSSSKVYKYILFWGDRSITNLTNNISGTSSLSTNPTYDMSLFYLPSQTIALQGNATFINGGVIANIITLGGSSTLNVNLPTAMESIFGQNSRPKVIQ